MSEVMFTQAHVEKLVNLAFMKGQQTAVEAMIKDRDVLIEFNAPKPDVVRPNFAHSTLKN